MLSVRRLSTMILVVAAAVGQADDLNDVRRDLLEACGSRLHLLDENLAEHDGEHGGGRYWFLHLRPKEVGDYSLAHRCANTVGMYPLRETIYQFSVAAPGTALCHSFLNPERPVAPECCLGDCVVVVVDISPKYHSHTFSLKHQEPEKRPEQAAMPRERDGHPSFPVKNQLLERLECIGVERGDIIHRSMERSPFLLLSFKAEAPGRFNLEPDLEGGGLKGDVRPIPVVIVPDRQPLSVLVSWPLVHESSPDGGGSHGSWNIGQEAAVLRLGDVLRVRLFLTQDSADGGRVVVQERPFQLRGRFIHDHIKWKAFPRPEKGGADE
jgi:hypothetical protein